jgi:hypothetical protein
VSRRLVWFNFGLGVLALIFAVALGRELMHSRPLPGPPQIRPAARVPVQPDAAAVGETRATGGASAGEVIASGNLFNPSRSSTGAAAEPTGPRPLLYGVVAGEGAKSRAYVEDPVTKMVRGYQVGDTVAGWRLDQIREDRVVIAGTERGMLEVLLRDPGKPRPALVASAAPAVMTNAPAVAPGPALAQRIEPGSQPARQASPSDGIRDAAPRGVGAIPAQLVRPARAQPTSQRTPAGQE